MFTVNGQYAATDTMQPGRDQIWRIADMSSNVTYVLELVDDTTQQLQTMNVLSLDGLVNGTSNPGQTDLHVGVKLQHILLMPASRADRTRVWWQRTRRKFRSTWSCLLRPRLARRRKRLQPAPSCRRQLSGSPCPLAKPLAAASRSWNTTYPKGLPNFPFGFESEVVTSAGYPIDNTHTIGPPAFPMQAMLYPNDPKNGVRRVCRNAAPKRFRNWSTRHTSCTTSTFTRASFVSPCRPTPAPRRE